MIARCLSLVLVGLAGCGDSHAVDLPWPLEPFPELPAQVRGAPPERVALGRLLFYDPIISQDGETACATCHSEIWGMSDGLARSIGHGSGLIAGPARKGDNFTKRNALPVWNLAYRQDLFWDGRTETLEEQAVQPLDERSELDLSPEEAMAALAAVPEYVRLFEEAFPDDPRVTLENFASAIATFERSIVSHNSLYDSYVDGDEGALRPDMIEGMFRFAQFGCDGCHTPPLFESSQFFDRKVPPIVGVEDEGRFEATEREEDRGKFRVPSLRNARFTEPYFHNGGTFRLREAVAHELGQGDLPFTDEDVALLTLFIGHALTDMSDAPTRPNQVPSGLPVPIDATDLR